MSASSASASTTTDVGGGGGGGGGGMDLLSVEVLSSESSDRATVSSSSGGGGVVRLRLSVPPSARRHLCYSLDHRGRGDWTVRASHNRDSGPHVFSIKRRTKNGREVSQSTSVNNDFQCLFDFDHF